ncbi:peptidoglycan DD-metalloendopeptidase family protein [Candidatus Binatia bacterium]|nr:peptidoglycan DD-metalloendopeptidase family protein [Candidatus Binatia bacterium]
MTTGAVGAALAATPLGTESLDALRHKPVKDVAREFEAMLLAQMIGAMRKTVGESGLLQASPDRRMMDGFFDLEMARSLVGQVDLGLAKQLTGEMERKHAASSDALGGATDAPSTTTGGHALQGSDAADGVAGVNAASDLLTPVAARVSSAYGTRRDPFTGEPEFHAGLDLAAPRGTPVRAAADGTVEFSGRRGDAGNLVEIAHPDGTRTRYAHLDGTQVRAGDTVRAGQVLGAVGSTGRSTGPHLHFAVERAGRPIDPEPLLDATLA